MSKCTYGLLQAGTIAVVNSKTVVY